VQRDNTRHILVRCSKDVSPGELSADDDEMIERRPFVRTAFGIRAISNNEEGKNKLPEPRIIAVQVT
jgi:hypothetical protein